MEVKAATQTMRAEAGTWDQQSEQLAAARTKVDDMELGHVEAGVFLPLVNAYNDLVRQLRTRCDEGAQAMTEVGEALRSVANTYDSTDEAAARKLKNIH